MELNVYFIFAVALIVGSIYGSPTQVVEIEDNNSDDCADKFEMFAELKGLIEESRDAVITHIDEQIDVLRDEIRLSVGKEILQVENDEENDGEFDDEGVFENNEEGPFDEDDGDICNPYVEESGCGEFGECILSEDSESYICECERGYVGDTCELVDHCAGSACLNGGECINKVDGFECKCPKGFTGERCEELTFE